MRVSFFFVCLVLLLLLCPIPSSFLSLEQRDVLIELYSSTNGQDWIDNENWDNAADPCLLQWYGVKCTEDKKNVLSINLQRNLLNGTLPSSLGLLSMLSTLILSENELELFDSPNFFAQLTKLEELELSDVNLEGQIPSSFFSLSSLQKLYLEKNDLNGDLDSYSWSKFPHLVDLRLSFNSFTGVLPTFSHTNLQQLSIANNKITGTIPSSYSELPLSSLILNENELEGFICDWICEIDIFDLQNNVFYCPLPECTNKYDKYNKSNNTRQKLPTNCNQTTKPIPNNCTNNNNNNKEKNNNNKNKNIGLIIGLSVGFGGGFLLFVILFLFYWFVWRKRAENGAPTELRINEVEMVEDLLRDSEDEESASVRKSFDDIPETETDSDPMEDIEY